MSRFLDGNIGGLEFPRDLPLLREEVEKGLNQGVSLNPLYSALAHKHPMALGELVVGPRALQGDEAARAALEVIEALTKTMQPKALFPRLAQLHANRAVEIVEDALNRYPDQNWTRSLAQKHQILPGESALRALRDTQGFESACQKHAQMHHTEALLELAAEGHLEPISALIAAGLEDHAILAASAALEHSPNSDVIAWMAASAGPNCDQLIRRLVPHLRSRAALEAMAQRSEAFPSAHGLLRTLLPAVR